MIVAVAFVVVVVVVLVMILVVIVVVAAAAAAAAAAALVVVVGARECSGEQVSVIVECKHAGMWVCTETAHSCKHATDLYPHADVPPTRSS